MRLLILLSVLIFGCSTTQPVSCPPPTTIVQRDTITQVKYVDVSTWDTLRITDTQYLAIYTTLFDTFYLPMANTELVTAYSDSLFVGTWFQPSGGDDYPAIQAAINYAQIHPGYPIHFAPGNYSLSHPLIVANRVGNDYGQSWIDLEGITNAKNAPASATANFIPTFTDKPVIILQQCKGCVIKNIHFIGKFTLPSRLNAIQIDTLPFAKWTDGVCSNGRTNPYTAIAIDPFSDSADFGGAYQRYAGLESYYLGGMAQKGSTDIRIENCHIENFVVGIVITPSNQLNGEEIDINNNQITNCRSAIATTQAQSKQNEVNNLMCWGGTYTVFDGNNYGFPRGDGSNTPMINGANIAGNVHQLFDASAISFPVSAQRIYAEGLFKIGTIWGHAGVSFTDLQIDFQNSSAGFPSPDFYYFGTGTTWEGCMLRLYNDGGPSRLLLNMPGNTFTGGAMSAPPFCSIIQYIRQIYTPPTFTNVSMYADGDALNSNAYDSVASSFSPVFHALPGFNGRYIHSNPTENVGDLIVSIGSGFPAPSNGDLSAMTAGFVSQVSGDTVYLMNTGVLLRDGQPLTLIDAKIKAYEQQ